MHKTFFSLVLISFLSSAGLLSADEIQFPKTKYVAQIDGKDKELNANLIFSDGLIVVKARKGNSVFASIPYGEVNSIIYERSTHARIKTAILLSPWALLSKGKKHWLTITYKDEEGQDFVLLKLDKKEYKRILATAETETEKKVERIIED